MVSPRLGALGGWVLLFTFSFRQNNTCQEAFLALKVGQQVAGVINSSNTILSSATPFRDVLLPALSLFRAGKLEKQA